MFAKECKDVVQVQPFCFVVMTSQSFLMVNGKEVCVIPDHVIDGHKHLPCDGNDCLLMAAALFQRLVFVIKVGFLLCALDSGKGTLHEQGLEVMPAIPNLCGFLLLALSLFAGERPAQEARDALSRQTDMSAPISPRIYRAEASVTPIIVVRCLMMAAYLRR